MISRPQNTAGAKGANRQVKRLPAHSCHHGIAQAKSADPAPNLKRPVAPPVYHPQPIPKVLQTKAINQASSARTNSQIKRPMAPPVYRPGAKTLVQPKAILQSRNSSTAPPAYRREEKRVAPRKMAAAAGAHIPKAPPVYRPAKQSGAQPRMTGSTQMKNRSVAASLALTNRLAGSSNHTPTVKRVLSHPRLQRPPMPGAATVAQAKLRVKNVKGEADLTVPEAYTLVSEFFSYQHEHERRFGDDIRVALRKMVERRKTMTFNSPGDVWGEVQRLLLRRGIDIYSWGDSESTKRQMGKSLKAVGKVRERFRDKEDYGPHLAKFGKLQDLGPRFADSQITHDLFRWHVTSQLGRDLGLNRYHELALLGYSQPDKQDKSKAHHMFEDESWGRYGSGWNALEEALSILPSFSKLGVMAPVFRVERADSAFMKILTSIKPPVYVYHGFGRMPRGQRHQLSAGLISSVHVCTDARARGVLELNVKSARYINAWGGMSPATDGAEVLIPAGTITMYVGKSKKKILDENYDIVYTLEEQDPNNLDPNIPVIEDHTGTDISKRIHTKGSSTTKQLLPHSSSSKSYHYGSSSSSDSYHYGSSSSSKGYQHGSSSSSKGHQYSSSSSSKGYHHGSSSIRISQQSSGVIDISTWQEASYRMFRKGQKIRITNHQYDISDRIFVLKHDYDPSLMEYPDINKYVEWLH
jgi:hypothetical protein